MFPKGTPDPEYPSDSNQSGTRLDDQNLVQTWLSKHQVMWVPAKGPRQGLGWHRASQGYVLRLTVSLQGARYVWNRSELIQASQDPAVTHLMGNTLVLPSNLSEGLHGSLYVRHQHSPCPRTWLSS